MMQIIAELLRRDLDLEEMERAVRLPSYGVLFNPSWEFLLHQDKAH